MYLRPRGRALFPLLPRPPGGSSPLPAWTPPPSVPALPPPPSPLLCSHLLCRDSQSGPCPRSHWQPGGLSGATWWPQLPTAVTWSPAHQEDCLARERGAKCSDHMYPADNNQSQKGGGWEGR